MQTTELAAGRELDALIGVTIFGLEYWPGRKDAVIPRGVPTGETMRPCHFWPVSTDIAAAWRIIDWMYQQPDDVLARMARELNKQSWYGPGQVQALRICRAALSALETR